MRAVYAVVDAPPDDPALRGPGGEALRYLELEGFSVVMGEVASAPVVDAATLRAHDAFLRVLHGRVAALLPLRFGTVLGDDDAVRSALSARAEPLREAVALVRGREQMTVRIFGDAAALPPPPDDGGGPGTRYLRARAHALALPQIARLEEALGDLVQARRVERHESPGLLASVYHLVPRGSAARYQAILDDTAAQLLPLRLTCSGAWPAYAFAPEAAA